MYCGNMKFVYVNKNQMKYTTLLSYHKSEKGMMCNTEESQNSSEDLAKWTFRLG